MADAQSTLRITAENATKSAFDQIRRSMGEVESASGKLSGALSALGVVSVGLSVGGLLSFIKGGIGAAAALDDLAEKTGASVEELSKLQQVARIGGHDFGIVESFLIKMNKALHATDEEAKGANRALEAIGLRAEDLRGLDPGVALKTVADSLAKFADSGGKTAAILALTGKSAAEALPFLKDLAQEQDIVSRVTAEQAAQAEDLEKAIRRLGNASTEAGQAIARELVPGLTAFVRANVEAIKIAGSFGEALRLFVFNLDAMTSEKPAEEIKRLTKALTEYQQASSLGKFVQSPTGSLFGGREEDLKKQIELLKFLQREEALATSKGRGRLDAKDLGPTTLQNLDFTPKPGGRTGKDRSAEEEAKARKEAIDSLVKSIDLETEAYEDSLRAMGDAVNGGKSYTQVLEAQKAAIDELTGAAATKRLVDTLKLINDSFEGGGISLGEAATALEKLGTTLPEVNVELEKLNDIGRELGLTFQSAFEDAVIDGKKLQEVLQGVLKDIARIVLRKGVTEPLAETVMKSGAVDAVVEFAKSIFHRAGGGPVSGGAPYWVGERGPELFVPRQNGTIVPNGSSSSNTFNINVSANSREDATVIAQVIDQRVRAIVRGEIGGQMRPGGVFNPI